MSSTGKPPTAPSDIEPRDYHHCLSGRLWAAFLLFGYSVRVEYFVGSEIKESRADAFLPTVEDARHLAQHIAVDGILDKKDGRVYAEDMATITIWKEKGKEDDMTISI